MITSATNADPAAPSITWTDQAGKPRTALWCSVNATKPPARVIEVDDTMTADDAYRTASQGVAMLWSGDYQNARQLLNAMARRTSPAKDRPGESLADAFYRYRQARSHRARILSLILIPLDEGPSVPLRRAPDVSGAWQDAFGAVDGPSAASLQEVLGAIGAYEWRKNGLFVDALDAKIYPHYGTFAPIRSEYLDLVAQAPLPSMELAFDIGTGTGVLAAILAQRGVKKVIATDSEPRAIACAQENLALLGLDGAVEPTLTDMFPAGRAPVIVCNPPWLPGTPHTLLDNAVYDPKSRMLRAFLSGLPAHLDDDGEGWLIISDLAEHLGLRSREELLAWIEAAGLEVLARLDTRPKHPRANDGSDPFYRARSREITSLWRLGVK